MSAVKRPGPVLSGPESPLDFPTAQLIVLPPLDTPAGQRGLAYIHHFLADYEDAAGRLPHERTHNQQEAA